MEKKIHIGIIGLGAIGERLIHSFSNNEDVIISACCDTSQERLQQIGDKYSISELFTDYELLLEKGNVDAVYIAVPPKYHEKIVLASIEARKHILCEKPLANSVQEAEAIVEAIKNTNIVHAMHFPLNYQGSVRQFEKLIQQHFVGSIRRINLKMHFPHWPRLWQQNDWVAGREQGGYVLEVGVHWIQLIQRVFGRVTAVRSVLQFPDDISACETGIIGELKLENGISVLIDGMSNIAGEEQLEFAVYGTERTLMIRNWRDLIGGKNNEPLTQIPISNEIQKDTTIIQEFIAAIRENQGELYDFHAGYDAQVVLEALRHPENGDWKVLKY